MRKHILPILFLIAAGAIWWASISSTVRNPFVDNDNPLVVVSGYVPYTLTKQLAGDSVNVLMLLPPGAEPHSFEPTPGVLVSLKHANAFIYTSRELEPWVKDLLQATNQHARTLELASVVSSVQDPHIWMNLQATKQLAAAIKEVLVTINPAQQSVYTENLKKFDEEIDALDAEFQRVLSTCQSREVVHVGHLAFKNLTDAYGLTLTTLSGTTHDGEHSAKKLAGLIEQIKEKHLPAIFTEETLSSRLANTVAQETGTQIFALYPIEHISKQDFNQYVTYGELMRRNLDSLRRGLGCQV